LLVIPAEAGFSTAELVIQFLLVILTALNSGAGQPGIQLF
jgi:hypothetical protein